VKVCNRANFSVVKQAVKPFGLVSALVCILANLSVVEQSIISIRLLNALFIYLFWVRIQSSRYYCMLKMISLMALHHLGPVWNVWWIPMFSFSFATTRRPCLIYFMPLIGFWCDPCVSFRIPLRLTSII